MSGYEEGAEIRPKLTRRERSVLTALDALSERWPGTLTLFSASGSLVVFRTDDLDAAAGKSGVLNDVWHYNVGGDIRNDGGDPW